MKIMIRMHVVLYENDQDAPSLVLFKSQLYNKEYKEKKQECLPALCRAPSYYVI